MKDTVLLFLFLTTVSRLPGQDFVSSKILGLRAYGLTEASIPVAGLHSRPFNIEFDVATEHPPYLKLKFFHCDSDWKVTATPFVNDDQRNQTRSDFVAVPAPNGVRGYTFHYKINVPGTYGFEEFRYSGNYLYELWNVESDELLARGKFFVAEERLRPAVRVSNRQESSNPNPYYQVNEIRVSLAVPERDSLGVWEAQYLTKVDVYKNREIGRARRISTDDQDVHTFVNGYGTRNMEFILDDMEPGSEYRTLDIRSAEKYPPGVLSGPFGGADVSRFLGKVGADNDGASRRAEASSTADYVDFRFELLTGNSPYENVYVVGDFNGWETGPESMMHKEGERFVWNCRLRRGIYDYQYVVGEDWIVLEGNSWGTRNNYTAFVYYRDPRFGGFDRIVGVGLGRSPGGTSSTVN